MKITSERNIYGEVKNETDLQNIFRTIRREVEEARSRPALTELYKRAGYLITLTHTPAWEDKLGDQVAQLRHLGKEEFGITARRINRRAEEIGVRPDYDETWGR